MSNSRDVDFRHRVTPCRNALTSNWLSPANEVCEGYVFTGISLSTGGMSGPLHTGIHTPKARGRHPLGGPPRIGTPKAGTPLVDIPRQAPPGRVPPLQAGALPARWSQLIWQEDKNVYLSSTNKTLLRKVFCNTSPLTTRQYPLQYQSCKCCRVNDDKSVVILSETYDVCLQSIHLSKQRHQLFIVRPSIRASVKTNPFTIVEVNHRLLLACSIEWSMVWGRKRWAPPPPSGTNFFPFSWDPLNFSFARTVAFICW